MLLVLVMQADNYTNMVLAQAYFVVDTFRIERSPSVWVDDLL